MKKKFIKHLEQNIYDDMMSHRFLFNSPGLFSAGIGIANSENWHLLYKDDITFHEREKII